jgi:hypothetical protein
VVFLHNGTLFSPKKTEILSFISKWMELENIIKVNLFRLRPKIVYSPSQADYRSKTNAEVLLDMDHTLSGDCTWEE